ncbi:hypothetical protein M2352_002257 [Azospirillum fermentarium]|uniref:hypothetical protein n=1 Tax=Azospirillum fermentarium TaxID=1233114 RepID=UPI0022270DD2|nr:hypothetical protein [Azospirillum fermentarium]MCW2246666.1 hypothetical protein [Azospirillum fermentarium]
MMPMTITDDLLDPDLLNDAIHTLSRQPDGTRPLAAVRRLQAVRDGVCSRTDDCRRCPVECRLSYHAA